MVLPIIIGKECTSKLPVRQFSDLHLPPTNSLDDKLDRIWSALRNRLLKTESKIKQCASLLGKNKARNKKAIASKTDELEKRNSETDFHLPCIFRGNAKRILHEERSLKEIIAIEPNAENIEPSPRNKGTVGLYHLNLNIFNFRFNFSLHKKRKNRGCFIFLLVL